MKYLFTFLIFIESLYATAQHIEISGNIKDAITKEKMENVTVQLLDADSLFLEGAVTDKEGKFHLKKAIPGKLQLALSFVGYEPNFIYLENIQHDTKLGELLLYQTDKQLAEIVVEGNAVITKANRQIIFPSSLQIEISASAFELLSKMRLPGLIVNTNQNSITSLNNGNVQLRINNIKASVQDVLAILSSQVVKIEYIDMPGARYGNNIASVVNFVTRRLNSGLSGGVSLRNAATTGDGNENAYLRYNNRASEFILNYDFTYKKYNDKRMDTHQEFLMADGSYRVLEKEGLDSPFKNRSHNLSLTYNYTKPESSIFNAKISNSWNYSPFYNSIQRIQETGKDDLVANTSVRDKSNSPVIDLYYELTLPKKQKVYTNLVGSYINSNYLRNYAERLASTQTLLGEEYNYTVTGNKYSLIGEFIYEKYLTEQILWSAGIHYEQSYVENHYLGSTGAVTTSMDDSNLYLYTELDGQYKKLGFNIGIGFSRQYFKEAEHKYNFYTFRPKISLSYPLTKGLVARYSFSINPVLPTLEQLSNISQWQNAYEVSMGNPDAKPYRAYMNNLSINYSSGRFFAQLSGYYQRNPNPLMTTAVQRIDEAKRTYFVYSYANQKRFEHLQGRLYLQYNVIKDILYISAYGGINHYANKGTAYEHDYTGCFGGISLDGMYKNFSFSTSLYSGLTSMFGERRNITPTIANIAINYRLNNNIRLGIGVQNPFFKYGEKSGEHLLSDIAHREIWHYTKDLGNMAYITFSWNFDIGRKNQGRNPKFSNFDNRGTGIVK